MKWLMEFCEDSFSDKPTIMAEMKSPTTWREFLKINAPDLLNKHVFSIDRPKFKQQGTDNRWCSLTLIEE